MGSCRCGGKTVKFKTGQIKKASIAKGAPIKKGGDSKNMTARARKLRAAAIKKANKNATGCECTQ
jgi:hypothetical protein